MISRTRRRSVGPALVVLLAPGFGACTWFGGDPHVMVTSQPAGAEIFVDGDPTGYTTPTKLDLGGLMGGDHEITLKKRGFGDETRRVVHHTQAYTSRWVDGSDMRAIDAPFWWTLGDWFTPFAVSWIYVPHSLHVVLHPAGSGPVSGAAASDQGASSNAAAQGDGTR